MTHKIILASGSSIRADLLRQVRLGFEVQVPRVDEDAIKAALLAEKASPRDIADTLAEMKARKIADKFPEAYVIGCDQVLDAGGRMLSKPETPEAAKEQLRGLAGQRHMLLSAAVIYFGGEPIWRHVGVVRLRMRPLSDAFIAEYVARNWDSVRHAVGAYKLEEEGALLFSNIEGDYFNVLGMPLIEMMNYLVLRGVIRT
jgi:septum formation protein